MTQPASAIFRFPTKPPQLARGRGGRPVTPAKAGGPARGRILASERFAAPVIDAVTCQDIKTEHMQKIVNAAPTPGDGARVQGMISALVSAVCRLHRRRPRPRTDSHRLNMPAFSCRRGGGRAAVAPS